MESRTPDRLAGHCANIHSLVDSQPNNSYVKRRHRRLVGDSPLELDRRRFSSVYSDYKNTRRRLGGNMAVRPDQNRLPCKLMAFRPPRHMAGFRHNLHSPVDRRPNNSYVERRHRRLVGDSPHRLDRLRSHAVYGNNKNTRSRLGSDMAVRPCKNRLPCKFMEPGASRCMACHRADLHSPVDCDCVRRNNR